MNEIKILIMRPATQTEKRSVGILMPADDVISIINAIIVTKPCKAAI